MLRDAAQATPPAVVSGITLCGYRLEDWVLAATLFYTLWLMFVSVFKFIRYLRGKDGDKSE